jgi:hypothetical protein
VFIKDIEKYPTELISGDVTIFSVDDNTMYSGIIYKEGDKIYYHFTNRPILPLAQEMKVVLQFNIYLGLQ